MSSSLLMLSPFLFQVNFSLLTIHFSVFKLFILAYLNFIHPLLLRSESFYTISRSQSSIFSSYRFSDHSEVSVNELDDSLAKSMRHHTNVLLSIRLLGSTFFLLSIKVYIKLWINER